MFPNRDPKHFNSTDQATSGNVMWVTLQALMNLCSIKQRNNGSNRNSLLLLVVQNVLWQSDAFTVSSGLYGF